MKPPPARPCPAPAGTPAWSAPLTLSGWLLALIVLLAGMVGALHDHGPQVAEQAPDTPSATLFALTPHAIIRDATHVAIVLERKTGSSTVYQGALPGLPTVPEPKAADAATCAPQAVLPCTSLHNLLRGAVQARGPPATVAT